MTNIALNLKTAPGHEVLAAAQFYAAAHHGSIELLDFVAVIELCCSLLLSIG